MYGLAVAIHPNGLCSPSRDLEIGIHQRASGRHHRSAPTLVDGKWISGGFQRLGREGQRPQPTGDARAPVQDVVRVGPNRLEPCPQNLELFRFEIKHYEVVIIRRTHIKDDRAPPAFDGQKRRVTVAGSFFDPNGLEQHFGCRATSPRQ